MAQKINSLHIIDPEYPRRSKIARLAMSHGCHAEIYEGLSEFNEFAPKSGGVLLHDDEQTQTVATYFAQGDCWLPTCVYASQPRPRQIIEAGLAGAIDYFSYPPKANEFAKVLTRLSNLASTQRQELINRSEAQTRMASLTIREAQVLREMMAGKTARKTGAALGISPRTVEIHRGNLQRKLGAKTSAHAIRIALDGGSLKLPLRPTLSRAALRSRVAGSGLAEFG